MVTTSTIDASALRALFCADFEVVPRDSGYLVHTPFAYDDGDLVTLHVYPAESGRWVVSDGGDVFMRLSYRLEERALQTEMRRRLIESAYAMGEVTERDGVLFRDAAPDQLGQAVLGVTQAALRIMTVSLLTQERVRSAFIEDLRQVVTAAVPPGRWRERWHDPDLDPHGLYRVDWRIETPGVPVFVFALTNTSHVKDATITLHQYERWEVPFTAIGIAENQRTISRRSWAQFREVSQRAFPQLPPAKDRIQRYIERLIQPSEN